MANLARVEILANLAISGIIYAWLITHQGCITSREGRGFTKNMRNTLILKD